jgi:bifunctional DNA-binding transcriptional regulator/antitoxin component of YhaV-PrlF toxin-antitoxin module
MQEYTINMTSKGQFTMPFALRREFGLSKLPAKLTLKYNPSTKVARIEKPISFEEVQRLARRHLKPGSKPLLDAKAYYQTRKPRI